MSKNIFVLTEGCDVKEIKKSNHCYIVAKNGIFFKDNQDMIETCTKIDTIEGLSHIKPYIKWKFPKISPQQIKMVVKFFKIIYMKHQTECMVLIGWNRKEKKIQIIPPIVQRVTGASIKYELSTTPGLSIIGSIHSHAGMSAFHSGVDINDEMNFDGLHITLGKFSKNNDNFQISSQVTSGKTREDIKYNDVIDGILTDYSVNLKVENLRDCSEESIIKAIQGNKCEMKFESQVCIETLDVSEEETKIISEWLNSIDNTNLKTNSFIGKSMYGNHYNFTAASIRKDKEIDKKKLYLAELYGVDNSEDLLLADDDEIEEYYKEAVEDDCFSIDGFDVQNDLTLQDLDKQKLMKCEIKG